MELYGPYKTVDSAALLTDSIELNTPTVSKQ